MGNSKHKIQIEPLPEIRMDIFDAEHQQEFFNSFAEKYHKADWFAFGFGRRASRNAFNAVEIPKGSVVCDLMCGDGKNIPFLLGKFHCKKIYAVDLSEKMIGNAKRKIVNENIVFLNENSLQLSLPDNSVDAVTCTFGIKTLKLSDQKLLLHEISRILKPNGVFMIAEVSKPTKKIPFAFSYLFFNVILEIEAVIFNYKFIRKKFLWRFILAFGSSKAICDYSTAIFPNVQFFSWYGGMVTGFSGRK